VSVRAQSTAVSSVAPPSTIYEIQPVGQPLEVPEAKPLVDWLPFGGKAARDKGFDLPLPFGVGLTYTYIKQDMTVSDVQIQGHPLNVNIHDADTRTHTGVFRGDVWLLPFLNVYGLVGETAGVTHPAASFANGQVVEGEVTYNRPSYGGGMTVAGGWKAYFAMVDANWTTGPLVTSDGGQISDKPIQSFTITPRLGVLFSSGKLGTGSLWIGGMYLLSTSEIHDTISLAGTPVLARLAGTDTLNFSARVKPRDPWNVLLGGNWEINKHWCITAEVGGILNRFQAIGSVMFRF
jgi:hypothetical protein